MKKIKFLVKYMIPVIIFLCLPVLFAGEATDEPVFIQTPDVVYVGSPYDIVSQMLHMAGVKKDDLVVDLGCGDAERNNVSDLVKIIQADIFTVDISDADVLPIYLLPEMNLRLVPQFETLKPGSRLVFHNYDLSGYIPDKKIEIISNEDNSEHTLWLYTTPLKKAL